LLIYNVSLFWCLIVRRVRGKQAAWVDGMGLSPAQAQRARNEMSVPAAQGWNDKKFDRPFTVPPNSKVRVDAGGGSVWNVCVG
jgi:hypothetical protein